MNITCAICGVRMDEDDEYDIRVRKTFEYRKHQYRTVPEIRDSHGGLIQKEHTFLDKSMKSALSCQPCLGQMKKHRHKRMGRNTPYMDWGANFALADIKHAIAQKENARAVARLKGIDLLWL